jgi:uncharacterized membrane protein
MNVDSGTATAVTVLWALAVVVGGIYAGIGPILWAVVGVVALVPAFFLARLRDREDPSLSQSIQRALL